MKAGNPEQRLSTVDLLELTTVDLLFFMLQAFNFFNLIRRLNDLVLTVTSVDLMFLQTLFTFFTKPATLMRSVVGFPFTWFPVLGGVLRNGGEGDAASDDLKIETVSLPNLQDRIRG